MLYAGIACGVVVRGTSGEVIYANPAAEQILGLSLVQMRGRAPESLWQATREDGSDLPISERPGATVLWTRRPVRNRVVGVRRPDGERRWVQVDSVPAVASEGQPAYVITSCVDVTARRQTEEALQRQAIYDSLTALPNRNLFRDRVEQAIQLAQRQHRALGVLVMGLDGFKALNDAIGRHWGDVLLQQVGQRLRRALRASDTVARLGGDEFGMLLPLADGDGALVAAHKVQQTLKSPFELRGQQLNVRASVGIALWPDHAEDAEALLHRADVAMYVAKRSQSGYALHAGTDEQHSFVRLSLASELTRAVEQGQLVLHYQPKVDYRSGCITSVEALVRWQHPAHGLIAPDRFVALAEQTGLILPLTRWVLNTALQQCHQWQNLGLAMRVAVNLSMRNLQDPDLVATMTSLLQTWTVAPSALTVELTETAFLGDPDRALEVLTELSQLGVRIAIDDFGTGYSSLGYLRRLPIHQIKIDKSFVGNMALDKNDFTIVRSTIDLAHNLGLRVIAEGVEDHATWNLLSCLGCDAAQGNYVGCPLPPDDLLMQLVDSPWPPRLLEPAARAAQVPHPQDA
jgi:diguanylate cyclase (GGDEF)-like protein/PAS domain S-box-containing protein